MSLIMIMWADHFSNIHLIYCIATERPRQPLNFTVAMHPDHHSLTLRWDAPANINRFDLEHYTIQVLSSEEGQRYQLNVTGSELEYPFGVIMNTSITRYGSSNLAVSAVSKCSQQGSEASATVTVPTPNININVPMDGDGDTLISFDSAITFDSNGMATY